MLARHRRGNVKLVGFGNIFAGRGARGGPIVATTVRRRPDLILKSEPGKGSFKNCVKVLSVFCCSGLDSSAVFYYQRFIVLFGKLQCRKCVSDKAPKAAKPHRGLDDATSALKRTIFSRAVQFCVFFFPETTQMRVHNFRRRDDHSWQTIGSSSSGMPRRTLGVMRCRQRKEGISADVTGASIDDNRAAVFQRRGQKRGRAGSRFPFSFFYLVCSFVQLCLRFVDRFVSFGL